MDKAQTSQDWTIQNDLSDTTVTALKENGFDFVQSSGLLNTAMIQKHFSKSLTLGQTLLLQTAVKSLSKVPSVWPDVVDPQGISAATVKDTNKDTMSSAATSSAVAPASTLDATLQQQDLDAASLLNLISVTPETLSPPCLQSAKRGRRLKWGIWSWTLGISSPSWTASPRCSVWRHLCSSCGKWLSRTEPLFLQYAGYLIKIANMGQRFQCKSVLKYDSEYRRTQAEAGFPYGADSSFMMQLFLWDMLPQDQSMARPSASSNTRHPQNKFHPQRGKPICGQFKSNKGCQLQRCKFAHVCRACYNPHSFSNHKEQAPTIPAHSKNSAWMHLPLCPHHLYKTYSCLGAVPSWWLWQTLHPSRNQTGLLTDWQKCWYW